MISAVVFECDIVKVNGKYIVENLSIISKDALTIDESRLKEILKRNFRLEQFFMIEEDDFKISVVVNEPDKDRHRIVGFLTKTDSIEINNRLFDTFDSISNVYVMLYSENGRVVFANKAFLKDFGYEREDVVGRFVCDFFEEPHKSICIRYVEDRLNGKKFGSKFIGVKVDTKDGGFRFISVYGNTVKFNGKPAGLLLGLDATAENNLRQIYIALKNVNQLIIKTNDEHELFDNICKVLVASGFKAAIVGYVNPDDSLTIKHMAGEAEEFFNRIVASVNGTSKHGTGIAAQAYRTGKIIINSNTKDNPSLEFWRDDLLKYNFLSHCAIPIKKNGQVKYILLVFSDKVDAFVDEYLDLLTELSLDVGFAVEKIEKERYTRLIERVLDRIDECVTITDEDFRIEHVNKAFTRLLGYEKNEVLGKTAFDFIDKQVSCESDLIRNEVLSKGVTRFESSMLTKDGRRIFVDISLATVKGAEGKIKVVGIFRDITKLKKQEYKITQLNRLYKTLFYLNEAIMGAENENDIFKKICSIFVEHLDAAVSLLVFNVDGNWQISYAAISDDKFEPFVNEVKDRFSKGQVGSKELPFIRSFDTLSVKLVDDMVNDRRVVPFKSEIERYNLKKCFAIPIYTSVKRLGVLAAVFDRDVPFNKDVVSLLDQVVLDLSAAIESVVEKRWNRILSLAVQKGFSYVVVLDEKFRIIFMNEAAIKLHGYSKEEILGKRQTVFSSGLHDYKFVRRFVETLKQGKVFSDIFSYRAKDGRVFYGYTTIIPYTDGVSKYYIAVGRDITEETQLKERLIFLLNNDLLTGLPNKEEFIRKAQDVLEHSEEKDVFAVAIVDIRNCSYVNQVYGYKGGDDLIKLTAERIKGFAGNKHIVGRLAGDKFALFLSGFSGEEDVLVSLNGLLAQLTKTVKLDGESFKPSYCIGVSFYPSDGGDVEDLLTKAESALLSAKAEGENEIGFYKKNKQLEAIKIIELKNTLHRAFKNGELVLFYQPYFDVKTRKVVGAESLIRWIKDGKVISPGEFIEVLEDSEFIYDVEENLVNQAVETITKTGNKVALSVNISAKSFKRDYLLTVIRQALEEHGVEGRLLTIEIVERVFLEGKEYTKHIMNQLKQMGVNIAVDDFGTGYSSLTYIRELPIDVLKIDISFVRGMVERKEDLSLVRLIINVAKEFGFKTVAEGVETWEQFDLLKGMGCDYVQGYLLAKPMPKDEFLSFVK